VALVATMSRASTTWYDSGGGTAAGGHGDYTYIEYASGEREVCRHVRIVSWALTFTAVPEPPRTPLEPLSRTSGNVR
jgi:hypothetical protein